MMNATLVALLQLTLVAYLPGAALFRLPYWNRERRAKLDAEERAFWHVHLSLAWTLTVVLALAAAGEYRFTLLLGINSIFTLAMLVVAGRRLKYEGTAKPASWTIVLPLCLVALGLWRFFPVSEYIIGGKDPGVYVNEGIQIAQRGTLVITDHAIAAVPPFALGLFYRSEYREEYYSAGFMGFFIQDPASGRVIGQFPHLFPSSMAVGYGIRGLTGALQTVAGWALLGLLGVYFAGARLFGRGAGFAAAGLLGLHVAQVWFARYPNSDVVLQAALFASLLAFARAHQDADRFFGPVAAWLIGLQLFSRVEALLAIVILTGTVVLVWLTSPKERLKLNFLVPLMLCMGIGLFYLTGLMRGYSWRANVFLVNLPLANVAAGAGAAVLVLAILLWGRQRYAGVARRWIPIGLAGGLVALAAYGYLFRTAGGRLAQHDADTLRTFVDIYLWWPVLVAALAGLVILARRGFWRDPAFAFTFAGFSIFLLYKMHIVPEHFWLARRFLAIILPGSLLLASAAALGPLTSVRGLAVIRPLAGAVLLGFTAQHYAAAAAPVIPHVEYRNIIPYLERLAARFTGRDLIIMESRNAESDIHVLGLPLAYIYAKPVLVLNSPKPDRLRFRYFVEDALRKYDRVFFVGTGGTTLLSRELVATSVDSDRVQIDEFEVTQDRLPRESRRKEFDYGVYQLSIGQPGRGPFTLDVGLRDDLHVLRFHAKEESEGRSIRWTQDASEVALSGLEGGEEAVTLLMSDGGRPSAAVPARVRVLFNGVQIGEAAVAAGFHPYVFPIPPALAAAAARADEPATLRLESTVWVPRDITGARDTRQLGVMLDTVSVR
ncbi:MAG: hypothetical protein ABIP90_01805 [Vicinamibacterales bacterium]